jgi:uncharacterized protein
VVIAFWPTTHRLCLILENTLARRILVPMSNLVRVEPVALLPTQAGCAVFLGDGKKVIMFYIDPSVGASINASLSGQAPLRPLTHDLYLLTLKTFGASISRAIIVRMEQEIYYGRLILEAENEVMERKIVELDARPSDCIALAVRCGAPLYVFKELWESLQDVSKTLLEMQQNAQNLQDDQAGPLDLGIL